MSKDEYEKKWSAAFSRNQESRERGWTTNAEASRMSKKSIPVVLPNGSVISGNTIYMKDNPSNIPMPTRPSQIKMSEKRARKAEDNADWENARLNDSSMPNTKIGMALYKKKVAAENLVEDIKQHDITHDIGLAVAPVAKKVKSKVGHIKSAAEKQYEAARAKEAAKKAEQKKQEEEDLYEEVERKTPSGTVQKAKKRRTETTTKEVYDRYGNKIIETTTKPVARKPKHGFKSNVIAAIEAPALMAEKRKIENAKQRAALKKAGIVVSRKPEAARKAKPGPGVRKGTIGRNPGGLPVKSHKDGPGRADGGLPVKSHKSGPGVRREGLGTRSKHGPAVRSGYKPGHKSNKPGPTNNIPKAATVHQARSVNFSMRKRSRK